MLNKLENLLNKWPIILVFSFLVALTVHFRFLFGSQILKGDVFLFQIPYLGFLKDSILNGDSFLWNPHNSGGFPAYASLNGFFSPIHYIVAYFFSSPVTIFNFLIFLCDILAMFFMAMFLREMKLNIWVSIFGSICFLISEMLYRFSALTNTWSVVLLPFLFWLVLRISRTKKYWQLVVFGGLGMGLGWLSAMPHLVLWIIISAFAFAIYLSLKLKDKKILLSFLSAGLVGFIIGFIQLISVFQIFYLSNRGQGLTYGQLSEDSIRLIDLPRFFFPDFYTKLPIYRSQDNITQGSEATLYMGIISFVFFISSFFINSYKNYLKPFFKWLFGIPLIIGIKYSPLFFLISGIPILNSFRIPSRYMLVGSFATVVLSSITLDYFSNDSDENKSNFRKNSFYIFSFFSIILTLVILFLTVYFYLNWVQAESNIGPGLFWSNIIVPIFYKPVILLLMLWLSWFFIFLFYKNKIKQGFLIGLIFIAIFDFIFSSYSDTDTFSTNILKNSSLIEQFLKGKDNPYGLSASLFSGEFSKQVSARGLKMNSNDEIFVSNMFLSSDLNLLHGGINSGEYYETLLDRNVTRLYAMLGIQAGDTEFFKSEDNLISSQKNIDGKVLDLKNRKKLFDFLNLRYLVSSVNLSSIGFEKKSMFPFFNGNNILTEVGIYENSSAKPLFYFINKIDRFDSDNENIFKEFKNNNFDGFFIECALADCNKNSFTALGSIDEVKNKNIFHEININSDSEQFLIFSQNFYKGWRAYIDGVTTPIYKVNTVHMGIFLPAGKHVIVFKYELLASLRN